MLPRKPYTMPRATLKRHTVNLLALPSNITAVLGIFCNCEALFPCLPEAVKVKQDRLLFISMTFLSLPLFFPSSSSSPYIPTPQASGLHIPSWPPNVPEDDLELLLLSLHLGLQTSRTSRRHHHHQTHSLHSWGPSLVLCAWSTSPLPLSQIPSPLYSELFLQVQFIFLSGTRWISLYP